MSGNRRVGKILVPDNGNRNSGLIMAAESLAKETTFVLLQLDIVYGDPVQNIEHVSWAFDQANLAPGEVVVLPELWNTAYDLRRLRDIADRDGRVVQRLLAKLARRYRVYIIGGSIARRSGDGYFNTTYCFDPQGNKQGEYDKVHLFGLMAENRYLSSGNHGLVVTFNAIRIAPIICYDIRFPEWLRTLALAKVDIFVVSAQWPAPRLEQWRVLLRARAVENQAFVIAVNRSGEDPDNVFPGNSLAVAPSGKILLELGSAETIGRVSTTGDFSPSASIPVFTDRRPELYH